MINPLRASIEAFRLRTSSHKYASLSVRPRFKLFFPIVTAVSCATFFFLLVCTRKSLTSNGLPGGTQMRDVSNVLAQLVEVMSQKDKTIFQEMEKRQEKIDREHCTCPEIGNLVEVFGYDFLLQTLELDNATFFSEYPAMKSLDAQKRHAIKIAVQKHHQTCRRCQLEAEDYREWDKEFERFLAQDKEVVQEILNDDQPSSCSRSRASSAGAI